MMREWVGEHRVHLAAVAVVCALGYGALAVLVPAVADAAALGVLATCGVLFLLLHVCKPRD